jgi:hypothetical protein
MAKLRTEMALFAYALISAGCIPRSHPRGIGYPPMEAPPGLVVIETRPGHPGCTGAIVHNAPGAAYVLTAGHCVFDSRRGPAKASVLLPRARDMRLSWARYRIVRVLKSPAAANHPIAEENEVKWISDWALLEIPTETILPALPLLELGGTDLPRSGDAVLLQSFFDVEFDDDLRAHAHDFAWGHFSRELVQRGHSGAPVLWNGRLAAVFSGATARFSWLSLSRQPHKLTLVNVATIRREAALAGLVL